MTATLLIDSGNTRAKWVWVIDGVWSEPETGIISEICVPPHLAQTSVNAAISCVSGVEVAIIDHLKLLGIEYIQRAKTQALHEDKDGRLINSYANPAKMGVDRWLAMLAAQSLSGGAAFCVVDAGTAMTFDAVDANGQHIGGAIAPGLAMLRNSLRDGTKISADWAVVPQDMALGKDTESALSCGVIAAAAGVVDRCLQQLPQQNLMQCFISGGDAGTLSHCLSGNWHIEPDLVFQGLHRWSRAE